MPLVSAKVMPHKWHLYRLQAVQTRVSFADLRICSHGPLGLSWLIGQIRQIVPVDPMSSDHVPTRVIGVLYEGLEGKIV